MRTRLSAQVVVGRYLRSVRPATATCVRVMCAGLARAVPRPGHAPHNREDDEEKHYERQKEGRRHELTNPPVLSSRSDEREHSPNAMTIRTITFGLKFEPSPFTLLTATAAEVEPLSVPLSLI